LTGIQLRLHNPKLRKHLEEKINTIYTTVGIATTLRDGRSGLPIQAGAIDCCLLQNVPSGSEAHPASYYMGTGVVSRGLSDRSVMLNTHLHLVSKLRMSGAILLHALCAFTACPGTTTHLYLPYTARTNRNLITAVADGTSCPYNARIHAYSSKEVNKMLSLSRHTTLQNR
jgi:hypothetical protein